MTTLIKFIVATVLSLTLFSCNFDMNFNSGVRGNGEVVTEDRTINESFSAIKATEGLDVYLTQSDNESVSVEADGNLQELILTEVEDGVLKIHTKENIGSATSKKVRFSRMSLNYVLYRQKSFAACIRRLSGLPKFASNPIRSEALVIIGP